MYFSMPCPAPIDGDDVSVRADGARVSQPLQKYQITLAGGHVVGAEHRLL